MSSFKCERPKNEKIAKELMDKYNKAVANGEGNVIEGEKVCNTCIHPCKASGKRASCSLYDDGNNVDSKVRLHELKNMQGMSEATTKVIGEKKMRDLLSKCWYDCKYVLLGTHQQKKIDEFLEDNEEFISAIQTKPSITEEYCTFKNGVCIFKRNITEKIHYYPRSKITEATLAGWIEECIKEDGGYVGTIDKRLARFLKEKGV